MGVRSAQGRAHPRGDTSTQLGPPSSAGPAEMEPGLSQLPLRGCPCPAAGPGYSRRRSSAAPRPPSPRPPVPVPPLTAEAGILLLGADLANLQRAPAERGQHQALPQEVAPRVAEALRLARRAARHAAAHVVGTGSAGTAAGAKGRGRAGSGSGGSAPVLRVGRERSTPGLWGGGLGSVCRDRGGSLCLFLCSPSLRVFS